MDGKWENKRRKIRAVCLSRTAETLRTVWTSACDCWCSASHTSTMMGNCVGFLSGSKTLMKFPLIHPVLGGVRYSQTNEILFSKFQFLTRAKTKWWSAEWSNGIRTFFPGIASPGVSLWSDRKSANVQTAVLVQNSRFQKLTFTQYFSTYSGETGLPQ